ncbi:unnamed protein product [Arctogadus glacialis]
MNRAFQARHQQRVIFYSLRTIDHDQPEDPSACIIRIIKSIPKRKGKLQHTQRSEDARGDSGDSGDHCNCKRFPTSPLGTANQKATSCTQTDLTRSGTVGQGSTSGKRFLVRSQRDDDNTIGRR